MGRHDSESPVRARGGSPRRRSPPRRERSPPRHRSTNVEKISTRDRSPKRPRSRSPVHRSPVREKPSSRSNAPKHRRSPSPLPHSPVRQKTSSRPRSPKREIKTRSPPPISPVKEKPLSRTRSPKRKPRPSVSPSPEKEKVSVRNRSLSPRSKRLKRVKAEREGEKESEREHEKPHGRNGDRGTLKEKDLERRNGDRGTLKEKDLERDMPIEKNDKRSGRDTAAGNGSRPRHDRSASPSDRQHRGRRRSRSPYDADNRGRDEERRSRDHEQRNGEDDDSLAKMKAAEETLEAKEKQHKPSFELSGKLAAETNRYRGVTLLFNEPPDARKPSVRWRLYVFKGGEVLNEPLYVHRQSCYLFGRERRVADIPTDHPSCSKQHAVLQYREVEEKPDGTMSKQVRPYLMDLGSTNGTFLNDNQMEPQRYYELMEKDTIKFGNSSREYVILHENSAS